MWLVWCKEVNIMCGSIEIEEYLIRDSKWLIGIVVFKLNYKDGEDFYKWKWG